MTNNYEKNMMTPSYITDGLKQNIDYFDMLTPKDQLEFLQAFQYEIVGQYEREKFFMDDYEDFSDFILSAFKWEDTPQGFDYWQMVVDFNK